MLIINIKFLALILVLVLVLTPVLNKNLYKNCLKARFPNICNSKLCKTY